MASDFKSHADQPSWQIHESRFREEVLRRWNLMPRDPAHDELHLLRVVSTAKMLCIKESGDLNVVIPAAWMHDLVPVAKNDSKRSLASKLAAEEAILYLQSIEYPGCFLESISHCIEAHSFSAQIKPRTLEAQIVQDADRLDALGAIGIARLFSTAGTLGSCFYSLEDPFCEHGRTPTDRIYGVDHFYQKLFKIVDTLHLDSSKKEGYERLKFMKNFLNEMKRELELEV